MSVCRPVSNTPSEIRSHDSSNAFKNSSYTMETSEFSNEVSHMANAILDIVLLYALNKFHDTQDRLLAGRPRFLAVISAYVAAGQPVRMCLPAFPFKSANKVYKVLGSLPDKAEELALERLNTMCSRIRDLYAPGAKLTIISDGLVYNDLLGISDRDTWNYGESLRDMCEEKQFFHIEFSRLRDLAHFPGLPDKLHEISYVANATNFRRVILNKYGKDDIDIDSEIATNPDTKLTYLGYRRFLESDLQHIFPLGAGRTSNGYKRDVKYLAKQMLVRGYAFAGACKNAFPHHLRLSIHQSVGEHKVSMSLLNTRTGFTTPWHCSVALLADGEWISAPMGDFQKDARFQVVRENGRPSYFVERTTPAGPIPIAESEPEPRDQGTAATATNPSPKKPKTTKKQADPESGLDRRPREKKPAREHEPETRPRPTRGTVTLSETLQSLVIGIIGFLIALSIYNPTSSLRDRSLWLLALAWVAAWSSSFETRVVRRLSTLQR